jgi:hypothetical protein
MNELSEEQNKWFKNKIKGDYAEGIFRQHFNSMNYQVEQIGVEKIAPLFSSSYYYQFIKDSDSSLLIKRNLQRLPDFLVSKEFKDKDNKTESVDIKVFEVKFRKLINSGKEVNSLEYIQADLFWTYRNMIWNEMFYSEIEKIKGMEIVTKYWDRDKFCSNYWGKDKPGVTRKSGH